MKYKVMPFGKYRGRLLSEIRKHDPEYLNWVIITMTGDLRQSAMEAMSGGPLPKPPKRRPTKG